MIEDRLRSQASWHPSHAVARVSGHPSHCHCCSRWVQGQARLGWKWVQGGAPSCLLDPSHHIASHWLPALPCLAFAWPILLLINARGAHQQTTWQLRVMSVCTVSGADDEGDRDTEIDYRRAGRGRTGRSQGPTAGPQVISCWFSPPKRVPNMDKNKRCLQRRFELCPPPTRSHPHPPSRRLSQRCCHRKSSPASQGSMRYLQGSSKRRWWRSQPGKPHPSEPGEPRLAAPISRRLPLARAGRAQDLPASFASPCFAPTFDTVGNYPPRLPCLTTNSPQHPKRAIGVAQPGRAIPPLQAILPTEHAHDTPSRAPLPAHRPLPAILPRRARVPEGDLRRCGRGRELREACGRIIPLETCREPNSLLK